MTKTSPCWNGLIVPGSTLMYGSILRMVTFRPRLSSSAPIEAEASPLPSDDTTPPVTKMNLVRFASFAIPTSLSAARQRREPRSRSSRRIDLDRLRVPRLRHLDAKAPFERPQLLELLGALERRRREPREA